jgi:hypothetical protein
MWWINTKVLKKYSNMHFYVKDFISNIMVSILSLSHTFSQETTVCCISPLAEKITYQLDAPSGA